MGAYYFIRSTGYVPYDTCLAYEACRRGSDGMASLSPPVKYFSSPAARLKRPPSCARAQLGLHGGRLRRPGPRLQLHADEHVPNVLHLRREGAESGKQKQQPASTCFVSLCHTPPFLLTQGGFCSEVDFFPNATVAEYGRIVGEAAMMAGARAARRRRPPALRPVLDFVHPLSAIAEPGWG